MQSSVFQGILADLRTFADLSLQLSRASDESVREDLNVSLGALRDQSIVISMVCAIRDIHHAHPRLFPLIALCIALRVAI